MKRKELPGARVPELNTGEIASEVAVWETLPLFVQQTVVPGGMVMFAGENAYSATLTIVSPLWQETEAFADGGRLEAGTSPRSATSATRSPLFTCPVLRWR
jgi:hypothetical protein